jgi:hypothetical protein
MMVIAAAAVADFWHVTTAKVLSHRRETVLRRNKERMAEVMVAGASGAVQTRPVAGGNIKSARVSEDADSQCANPAAPPNLQSAPPNLQSAPPDFLSRPPSPPPPAMPERPAQQPAPVPTSSASVPAMIPARAAPFTMAFVASSTPPPPLEVDTSLNVGQPVSSVGNAVAPVTPGAGVPSLLPISDDPSV